MAKRYEDLKFTDDFMFCKVLSTHPDITEELISLLMGKKVHIVEINKQKVIEITANGRGIRLDVSSLDDDDVVYNLEMQNANEGNLPKRSRYHQGLIDLEQLERGSDFDDLKETFIIFICPFDPIGAGRYRYTFEARCMEDPEIRLGDESYRMFINSKSAAEDASPEMKAFLDYINGKKPESELTKKIDEVVDDAITHERWRTDYMTLLERDLQNRQEGRQEGEKRLSSLINALIKDGKSNLIEKVTTDNQFRQEQYAVYGIE